MTATRTFKVYMFKVSRFDQINLTKTNYNDKMAASKSSCGLVPVYSDQYLSINYQDRTSGKLVTGSRVVEAHWCMWGVTAGPNGQVQ